jgi:hypothetical protein
MKNLKLIFSLAAVVLGLTSLSGCFPNVEEEALCENTCQYAFDGDCDDGGPNSDYSLCDCGTDCADCGEREVSDNDCLGGGASSSSGGGVPNETLNVRFSRPDMFNPPSYGLNNTPTSRNFGSAYWNNGMIRFSDDPEGYISYVEIRNININGTGQYPILNAPIGVARLTNSGTYRTDVEPLFWTDGNINDGTLVQGGAGYDLSDYDMVPDQVVVQGGYLIISGYNGTYISGELYMQAWVYDNQLNREVATGHLYFEFSGVPYSQ